MNREKLLKAISVMLEDKNKDKFSDISILSEDNDYFKFSFQNVNFDIRRSFMDGEYEYYLSVNSPDKKHTIIYSTEQRIYWDRESKASFEALFTKIEEIYSGIDTVFDEILKAG